MSNNLWPAGIEYYLPLFFEHTATLFDYLGDSAQLILHGNVMAAAEDFWRDAQSRHNMAGGNPERPVLAPVELFLRPDELMGAIKPYARLDMSGSGDCGYLPLPELAVERRADNPLTKLADFTRRYSVAC